MGVGKSAIGRRIARELGFRFLDSDECIEKKIGKSIPEIFKIEGESCFRDYEREFIASGHPSENCVVSCGGGLAIQPGMMDALKEAGVVVCLFASVETILERTQRNSNRPLLQVEDPEEAIRKLLAVREPIYMQAGACLTTEGRTIAEVVQHLKRMYRSSVNSISSRAKG